MQSEFLRRLFLRIYSTVGKFMETGEHRTEGIKLSLRLLVEEITFLLKC